MDYSINTDSLKPIDFSIPKVSSELNWTDTWGAIKVRWGFGRDRYIVNPGLYKVGNPTNESDVFVSANYKLSFDALRKNLTSLNAWILVIDTKGVNVWCAAGKGTFGTDNIINSIKATSLDLIVKHRTIIVPQLGAVGVAAHVVHQKSGFRVEYGPVLAKDIKAFVAAGYRASKEMRQMHFPLIERIKLIPVDLMYGKYPLLISICFLFFVSGLDKSGFLFAKMIDTSFFPVVNLISAYIAGIVIAPILLPWIPFRAFALKGALIGALVTLGISLIQDGSYIQTISFWLINLSVSSFMTMNFTGSSTFTSLSGVKKEMKWALPIQIVLASIGIILFIIAKLF